MGGDRDETQGVRIMNAINLQAAQQAIDEARAAQGLLIQRLRTIHDIAVEMFDARNGESRITDICEWFEHSRPEPYNIFNVPGYVYSAEIKGDVIRVTFEDYFRGERDYETISIPPSWVSASDDEIKVILKEQLDAYYAAFEAHQTEERQQEERESRARYEALKRRFEPRVE